MHQPSQRAPATLDSLLLEGLLATTHDGVVLVEPNGLVTVKNGIAAACFGPELLGRAVPYETFRAAFTLTDLDGLPLASGSDPFEQARAGVGARPVVVCVKRVPRPHCLRAEVMPLLAEDGSVQAVLVTCRDLTEEVGLRQALTQKVTELEAALSALQEIDRLKSDFLNTMSHELRTPLTAIVGYVEFLEEGIAGPLTPQQVEFLSYVSKSSEHLLNLINDLLDFARLEAGKMHLAPSPVEVGPLLKQVMATMQVRAAGKHQRLSLELLDPIPTARADYTRVLQVLTNLVDNAIKFTPEGGSVTVRCRGLGAEQIYLEVEDTGVGIPEAAMPNLFSKFYQVQSGLRREQGGTGLGLAISKMLVEAQGGTIGLTSRAGLGTRVWFTLPVWSEALASAD